MYTPCLSLGHALLQAGGFTDLLLPDAGVQAQNRDIFAEFDESRVAAVVKDPSMPPRASLRSKTPDILSWPAPAAAALAAQEGNVALHLYRSGAVPIHTCLCGTLSN